MKRYLVLVIILIYILWRHINQKGYYKIIRKPNINIIDKIKLCRKYAEDTLIKKTFNPKLGVQAGEVFYHDVWTRDAFFSCLGILSTKSNLHIIKRVLTTLKNYQRKDGLIPLRVGSYWYSIRFLTGIDLPGTSAVYEDDKAGKIPTDSDSEFIILNYLLYRDFKDITFLQEQYPAILKAFNHMNSLLKQDMLIHGEYFDSWHDTFTINGANLFSNVLFVQAIEAFYEIQSYLKVISLEEYFQKKQLYGMLKQNLITNFWNGEFLKIYPNLNYMETAGNALAIVFNLVDSDKSNKILKYIDKNLTSNLVPVTIPQLPNKYIYQPLFLIGLEGYHQKHYWPWVNGLLIKAQKRVGYRSDKLDNVLITLTNIAYNYENHYERIDIDLKPVKHFFQSTEVNFSESAGMYLYATSDI